LPPHDWGADVKAEEEAYWAELRKKLAQGSTKQELAQRRELARRADELRVKVDNKVVDLVREMRGPLGDTPGA
jgi:hypothetical protein